MKTASINVMNLCVPCENRCRYCLLSYDGRVNGVEYKRSEAYAQRFYEWLRENRPDLSFLFGFGYSMEHPNLLEAIDFCRSIGSATGEFLQFDGMKFRTDTELEELLHQLQGHGIELIDLTFYGTESYHDRFAARAGDYRLMINTLKQANRVGLDVTVSIPITHENAPQLDELYYAEKEQGAFLNGQRIHASGCTSLAQALCSIGFACIRARAEENNLKHFVKILPKLQGIRRTGSAAFDLCQVAAGRCDGYWEFCLQPYDIAAGALIALEAGALFTDAEGGNSYPGKGIICAAPGIHGLLCRELN